jgi:predicted alpha/beta hydrolase family esterase
MPNAIIIHGRPSKEEYYDPAFASPSNFHWFPWLQKQLLIHDIPTATPEMPHAYAPDYSLWKREFERYDLTPGTLLVGHSTGTAFLLRYLSEHPALRVNKVILVAPSLHADRKGEEFYNFTIDPVITNRTKAIIVFYGSNDAPDVLESVELLRQTLPGVRVREFPGAGHFTLEDMGSVEFPELLAELLVD